MLLCGVLKCGESRIPKSYITIGGCPRFYLETTSEYVMDHECEKLGLKEATSESTSLISSLNLGSGEMLIEEHVQLAGEEIVDTEYTVAELVALAWGRETHLVLDLNEEPIHGNVVDDQPTPTGKLPQAHEYVQLLPNLCTLGSFQL